MRALFLAAGALLLAGCVPNSAIAPVNSLDELRDGEVLIVGKVVLDPPLGADEQDLGGSYEEFRNRALLIVDKKPRAVNELAYGDLSSRIDAPLGEHFFVRHAAEPFYILKGWVVMRAKIEMVAPGSVYTPGNAPLQGIFRVDVRPDDKAVYIGTIHYYRDEFFETEKVVVRDEFKAAQSAFRARFGDAAVLRKSLAQPPGR